MPIIVNGAINVRHLYVNGVEQSEANTNDNTQVFPPYSFMFKVGENTNSSGTFYRGVINPITGASIELGELNTSLEFWPVSEGEYIHLAYCFWQLQTNGTSMFRFTSVRVGDTALRWLSSDLLLIKWTAIEDGEVFEFEIPRTVSAFYKGEYLIDGTNPDPTIESSINRFLTNQKDKWVRCEVTVLGRGQHG